MRDQLTSIGKEGLMGALKPPFMMRLGTGFEGTDWLEAIVEGGTLKSYPPSGTYRFAEVRNCEGETIWAATMNSVTIQHDEALILSLLE